MNFEEKIHNDLFAYLQMEGQIDRIMPDAPDIEELWAKIGEAYLADGIREFAGYPTVALGWMMYVGMAVAQFWDTDWERYSKEENLYFMLRDVRGYDAMDEYIREDILKLQGEDFKRMETLVAECASRTHSMLRHETLEPGTKEAFRAFIDCLHQLYLMGSAVWLWRMGYKSLREVKE